MPYLTAYLTAKQLGILPEERKGLIAFVETPSLGRTLAVNGKAHLYDQGDIDNEEKAEENECGTAGCIAGFVFAHVRHVQKIKTLRSARNASDYIDAACEDKGQFEGDDSDEADWNWVEKHIAPLLADLYSEGGDRTLVEAKKVVSKALRTGKVAWPQSDHF